MEAMTKKIARQRIRKTPFDWRKVVCFEGLPPLLPKKRRPRISSDAQGLQTPDFFILQQKSGLYNLPT
jgi:hypothetical protein